MNAYQMARAAINGVKFMKGLINCEKKYMINNFNSNVSTTANVLLLTNCAEGDDETQRNGRSVLTRSVYVNGYVTVNASATGTVFRYVLFVDKNSNGVAPAAAEVLTASSVTSTLNQDNAGSRFTIIADKHITLYPAQKPIVNISCFRKVYHHTKWDGTTAVQADCVSGHIYLLMVSNEATNTPTPVLETRVGFYDN